MPITISIEDCTKMQREGMWYDGETQTTHQINTHQQYQSGKYHLLLEIMMHKVSLLEKFTTGEVLVQESGVSIPHKLQAMNRMIASFDTLVFRW